MIDSLIYIVKNKNHDSEELETLLSGQNATVIHETAKYLEYLSGRVLDLVIVPLKEDTPEMLWLINDLKEKKEMKGVPILVVADIMALNNALQALNRGADDLIYTPLRPAELMQRISTLIDKKHANDQPEGWETTWTSLNIETAAASNDSENS